MSLAKERLSELGLHPAHSYNQGIRILKNAYWYNYEGEFVGSSDMKIGQPQQVAKQLEVGELLAVLPSHQVLETDLIKPEHNWDRRDRVRDIADKFAILIVPRCIYLPGVDGGYDNLRCLGEAPTMSPKSAYQLIHSVQQLNT